MSPMRVYHRELVALAVLSRARLLSVEWILPCRLQPYDAFAAVAAAAAPHVFLFKSRLARSPSQSLEGVFGSRSSRISGGEGVSFFVQP